MATSNVNFASFSGKFIIHKMQQIKNELRFIPMIRKRDNF
jgi:hypothetical protein